MNNQQFRRLLFDSPAKSSSNAAKDQHGDNISDQDKSKSARVGTGQLLGSRMRSSIPMTPRHLVGGIGKNTASDLFARQLQEQQNARKAGGQQAKFRSSAAPKGSKLAAGYTDRAAQLRETDTVDDQHEKAGRVKALEEMLKLGQIDEATFEKLRDEIVGGDLKNIHLVKGLDRRLLARARAGEDVYGEASKQDTQSTGQREEAGVQVDDELDGLMEADVTQIEREQREKRGVAASSTLAGKKRTRDDILREMKEARVRAAAEKEEHEVKSAPLGAHFKRITIKDQPGTSRIEIDEHGREILIVVDAHGNVKRKIRKQKSKVSENDAAASALPMPDKSMKPLGMEVPDNPKAVQQQESEDIFSNAGSDYDPLGQTGEGSDESSEEGSASDQEEGEVLNEALSTSRVEDSTSADGGVPEQLAAKNLGNGSLKPRNYFATGSSSSQPENNSSSSSSTMNPISDPSILAAIKRASASQAATAATAAGAADSALAANKSQTSEKASSLRARLSNLERDRDEDDLDMGFGSSRFEDAEDDDGGRPVKLAKWTGLGAEGGGDDDEEDGGHRERGGQKQRKRGKKKEGAGGDKDDAKAILGIIERRKG